MNGPEPKTRTRRYAEGTEVPADRSRGEIERTLERYGATAFGYATENGTAMIQFKAQGRYVKLLLPVPNPSEARFTQYKQGSVTFNRTPSVARELYEKAARQPWRALALVVKAKLEAVEAGITTFENEFMAHIVMPNGKTFGETATPAIAEAYALGTMPDLVALTGGKKK
jgi:hypothetical protein